MLTHVVVHVLGKPIVAHISGDRCRPGSWTYLKRRVGRAPTIGELESVGIHWRSPI